jgi:enterochelin esterase family protein
MTHSFERGAFLVCVLLVASCAAKSGSPSNFNGAGQGGEDSAPVAGSPASEAGAISSGGSMTSAGGSGGDGGNGGNAGSMQVGGSSGSSTDPMDNVSSDGDGDRVVGPKYTPDPQLNDPAAPKGKRFNFTMTGAQSTIYKGINGSYNRSVSAYIPAQYDPAKPAALIVTQDALGNGSVQGLLDNLINKKMLPVIVAFFVSNGGGDYIGSERGLEYDTVSGLFAEYVMKEVIPRGIMEAKTQLNIDLKITDDPWGHATLGGSSGGAASFSMAWWRPDYFRRVITYSGTYVTQVPAGSPFPHGCWVYHDVDPYDAAAPNGLIVQHCEPTAGFTGDSTPGPCDTPLSQAKCEAVDGCTWNTKLNRPLRIWHESAEPNDLGAGQSPGSYRNFDLANQRMAAAFKLRGYHYHYDHALNAGHVDNNVVRQTIGEAMLWLWRGYPLE